MSGGKWHIAADGEDMASIAASHGSYWKTLWMRSENAELRALRRNPNVLLRGDRVFVPDRETKAETGATEQRHVFRRKGIPSKLRLRLLRDGEPRAGLAYRFDVDGMTVSGTTDAEGVIRVPVAPGATRGVLTLTDGDRVERRAIRIGHLDPVAEIRGVQQRLQNLRCACTPSGELDAATRDALLRFQAEAGLPPTGKADDATRRELVARHGC